MPYKEKEIERLYYTIGEVAKMFNVNTSHIRFWSKQFDAIKPATNKKGNRLYTAADIEIIRNIYHLVKEKGFTLKGAQVEMKAQRKKIKMEGKTDVVVAPVTDTTPTLFDNEPISAPAVAADHTVLKNSLLKIKTSLLQVQKELASLRG